MHKRQILRIAITALAFPSLTHAQEPRDPFVERTEAGATDEESATDRARSSSEPQRSPPVHLGIDVPTDGEPVHVHTVVSRGIRRSRVTTTVRSRRIRYREGMQVPEGARIVSHGRRGLVVTGAIMTAVTYGLQLMGAGFAEDARLAIPVFGSVLWARDEGDEVSKGIAGWLTGLQLLSALFMGVGFIPRRYVEYEERRRIQTIEFAPTFSRSGGGLQLQGSF